MNTISLPRSSALRSGVSGSPSNSIVPLMLLGAPFVFIIAPRQGAVTAGLAVAFLLAVLFDVVNVRNLLRALRVARRATS